MANTPQPQPNIPTPILEKAMDLTDWLLIEAKKRNISIELLRKRIITDYFTCEGPDRIRKSNARIEANKLFVKRGLEFDILADRTEKLTPSDLGHKFCTIRATGVSIDNVYSIFGVPENSESDFIYTGAKISMTRGRERIDGVIMELPDPIFEHREFGLGPALNMENKPPAVNFLGNKSDNPSYDGGHAGLYVLNKPEFAEHLPELEKNVTLELALALCKSSKEKKTAIDFREAAVYLNEQYLQR